MQSSESRRDERRAATAGLSLQTSDLTGEPSDQDLSSYGLAHDVPTSNTSPADGGVLSSASPSPHFAPNASMQSSLGGGSLNLTGRRIPRSLARALSRGGGGSSVGGGSDQVHSHSRWGGTPRGGLKGGGASGVTSPIKGIKPGPRADIHLIGELEGASGFTNPIHASSGLYCKWQVLYEPTSWVRVKGSDQGTTQACHKSSNAPEEDLVVWGHPVDLHLQTQTVQGWPSFVVMVYARETEGLVGLPRDPKGDKDLFVAYGILALPKNPGYHKLTLQTWHVVDAHRSNQRDIFAWFTGIRPRLVDESFVVDAERRDDAGPFVTSVGSGRVHLRINLIARNTGSLTFVSGEPLSHALEQIRVQLERKNRRKIEKIAGLRDEEKEEMEERERRADEAAAYEESEGLRLIRGGRDARLASFRGRGSREGSLSLVGASRPFNSSFKASTGRASSAGRGSVAFSGSGGGMAGGGGGLNESSKYPLQSSYRSRSTPRDGSSSGKAQGVSGGGGGGRRRMGGGDEPSGLNESNLSASSGGGLLGESMRRGQNTAGGGVGGKQQQQLESGEGGLVPMTEEDLARRREARRARRAQVDKV